MTKTYKADDKRPDLHAFPLMAFVIVACFATGCDRKQPSPDDPALPTSNTNEATQQQLPGVISAAQDTPVSGWRKVTPEENTTPLVAALLDRNAKRYEQLLESGADPNEWDAYGRNAVTVAAGIPNSQAWLGAALLRGGDPNSRAPATVKSIALLGGGFAPLHVAAGQPNNALNVRLLVESGADVNATNAYGMTPLGLAIDNRLFEVAAYLVDHGADPTVKGSGGTMIRDTINIFGTDDDAFVVSLEDRSSLKYLRERVAAFMKSK